MKVKCCGRLPSSYVVVLVVVGFATTTSVSARPEVDEKHDDKDYKFPATAPLESETHGGDDVAIFARGPWSHLLTGVVEQNIIPHVMAYASCVGDGLTICHQSFDRPQRSPPGRN